MKKIILYLFFLIFAQQVFAQGAGQYVPGELIVQLRKTPMSSNDNISLLCQSFPGIELSPEKVLSRRLQIWLVTFDPQTVDYQEDPPVVIANFITAESAVYHPGYNHDNADLHDLGVVLLPQGSTDGIDPAQMPAEGFLDEQNTKNGLKGTQFVAVGYGATRLDKTKGFQPLYYEDIRQFAAGTFSALTNSWLHISMNPSTGDGGTCYGDSGGPHFFGDSNLILSITVTGDAPCRASDVTYRLDTASAQSFLSAYIDFP